MNALFFARAEFMDYAVNFEAIGWAFQTIFAEFLGGKRGGDFLNGDPVGAHHADFDVVI